MKCSGKNCPMQYPYDVKACAILEICPHATLIPYTNADRIRAMSDEELAVFLCAVKFRRETILNVPDFLYIKDAHDWLQKPAEEDTFLQ